MPQQNQLNLPPTLLKRVADRSEGDLNAVESREIVRDLTLDEAKTLAGELVRAVIKGTDAALKQYGDKGQVSRWCAGSENPNLARLIQSMDARKVMAKALLRTCGDCVRERTVFEIEESA